MVYLTVFAPECVEEVCTEQSLLRALTLTLSSPSPYLASVAM